MSHRAGIRNGENGMIAAAAVSVALVIVIVIIVAGVVIGYYTRAGNDITARPSDGLSHGDGEQAPGAEGPGSIGGPAQGGQDPFSTRGTR
jgi:hypothetical protein